jgi:glycosyltransferase involved in cell wall biosynthesis
MGVRSKATIEEASLSMEHLILLTPLPAARTGNGLAMRSELFRQAAAADFDVRTVVVPVAGRLPEQIPLPPRTTVVPLDTARARTGIAALVADQAWRDRLVRQGRLPALARAASPGLADAVVRAVGAVAPAAVHVMRSYLAPLGSAVAEQLEAPWKTLDLDEEDAAVARALGDPEEATAYERLLGVFGPLFDGLSAASATEAAAIATRHRLAVEPVPNAVEIPRKRARDPGPGVSLLFVGNLTYPPNVEAASLLIEAVLPEVRRRLQEAVRVTLVGPCDERVERLAGPGVEVAGFVSDLRPIYASADVVVVPLRVGGGTRIKLLEAFAHEVPVVASGVAAAGLDVADERHLLLVEDAREVPAALERLVTDAALARRLVAAAARLVRDRYSTDAVIPEIRDFFRRAAARGRDCLQRSGQR